MPFIAAAFALNGECIVRSFLPNGVTAGWILTPPYYYHVRIESINKSISQECEKQQRQQHYPDDTPTVTMMIPPTLLKNTARLERGKYPTILPCAGGELCLLPNLTLKEYEASKDVGGCGGRLHGTSSCTLFVVVVVVFFTLTDRASTIPSNIRGCQSGTWSQRGTKVATGHIMVTTRYSDQQGSKSRQKVMRLYKRWHRPITKRYIEPHLLHIKSSLDRLGLLSPTHDQRSQQQIGQIRSNQF